MSWNMKIWDGNSLRHKRIWRAVRQIIFFFLGGISYRKLNRRTSTNTRNDTNGTRGTISWDAQKEAGKDPATETVKQEMSKRRRTREWREWHMSKWQRQNVIIAEIGHEIVFFFYIRLRNELWKMYGKTFV